MSKIICEICGTSYAETSTQCPICGYVRSAEAAVVNATELADGSERNYTYVKGGRFSKSNVKKRNRANQKQDSGKNAGRTVAETRPRNEKPQKKRNLGMLIVAIALLLIVLAFVLFMIFKLFWPELPDVSSQQTDPPGQQQEQPPEDDSILCSGIDLDAVEVTLTEVGEAKMLYATVSPADTTEKVEFKSSDEAVVTVSDSGKIVAVGSGEATIIVTCGSYWDECKVICQLEPVEDPVEETEDPTDDTEEVTEAPTVSLDDFKFRKTDITFFSKGESYTLYRGDIDFSLITWTSDDESIAKIEDGVVTAVGKGTTKVHAEINGVIITCIIRCNFKT